MEGKKLICGIIDLGSNTIRLSIYQCEDQTFQLLLTKKTVAGLSGYVSDGELSEKGVQRACGVLNQYKNILTNFHIHDAYVFATASLRNISNTKEAVFQIKEETGFTVDILSGKEEARLDFVGAVSQAGIENGVLIDIGGGSTELVSFEQEKIETAVSMPIGSLNLYIKYVPFLLPTAGGIKKIRKNVLSEIKRTGFFEEGEEAVMCGVGGTVRTTRKLYNDFYDLPSGNREMESEKISEMLDFYQNDQKNMANRILQIAPERIHTIIPGMVILETVAKSSRCKRIIVSKSGVREGYLAGKVLIR